MILILRCSVSIGTSSHFQWHRPCRMKEFDERVLRVFRHQVKNGHWPRKSIRNGFLDTSQSSWTAMAVGLRKRLMPRVAGHRAGVKAVRDVTETCARLGIEALTLYAFSLENWKRPRTEVDTLWKLLSQYLGQEFKTLMDNNVRLHAFGRLDALPSDVRKPWRKRFS